MPASDGRPASSRKAASVCSANRLVSTRKTCQESVRADLSIGISSQEARDENRRRVNSGRHSSYAQKVLDVPNPNADKCLSSF